MFLLLSTTIVEKDALLPGLRSSISNEARDGKRNKFFDLYDIKVSVKRVGVSNVSLDDESVDGKRSRSGTSSANEADDSELPQAKKPLLDPKLHKD